MLGAITGKLQIRPAFYHGGPTTMPQEAFGKNIPKHDPQKPKKGNCKMSQRPTELFE